MSNSPICVGIYFFIKLVIGFKHSCMKCNDTDINLTRKLKIPKETSMLIIICNNIRKFIVSNEKSII